jgi:hypothetical protein
MPDADTSTTPTEPETGGPADDDGHADAPPSDPMWRAILEGKAGGFAAGRGWRRIIPSSPRCKLCSAPFAGPVAAAVGSA